MSELDFLTGIKECGHYATINGTLKNSCEARLEYFRAKTKEYQKNRYNDRFVKGTDGDRIFIDSEELVQDWIQKNKFGVASWLINGN